MRQACGGPPALSQINHAADPVPSAWGPNGARMLSLSHGPGPLSSPQHSSSGAEGGVGGGTPQNTTLCILSSLSFFFFLLWALGDRCRERKTEALVSSSLHCSGNNGPFLLLIRGPCRQWPGSAAGVCVCVGRGFCLPGASRTCLETTHRRLCA